MKVQGGAQQAAIAPEAVETVHIPYTLPVLQNREEEAVLTVQFVLKESAVWAEKGHELAFEQFVLPAPVAEPIVSVVSGSDAKVQVNEEATAIVVSGDRFSLQIDKTNGSLVSYKWNGAERLSSGLIPNFWRAYTDNDRGNKHHERCATWRDAGEGRLLRGIDYEVSAGKVTVRVSYSLPTTAISLLSIVYTINGAGVVDVYEELQPGAGLPEIPEVGVMFHMPAAFDQISWYGKGPDETYWDRQTGGKLGLYSGKVQDQLVPYIRPQECGNKMEVRHATVTNSQGEGLLLKGAPSFELNVLSYTPAELEAHDHYYKLPVSNKTVVRVNHKQMGVGGNDSWGQLPEKEYILFANRTYLHRFTFQGI
ncbi:Beta-galactosidase [compost metagenome]